MIENQQTISDWALQAFGLGTADRAAQRACEEIEEFRDAVDLAFDNAVKVSEAADIVIYLYVFAAQAGYDLHAEVDRKMIINRQRKWETLGDGTGYYVKEPSQ